MQIYFIYNDYLFIHIIIFEQFFQQFQEYLLSTSSTRKFFRDELSYDYSANQECEKYPVTSKI